MSEAPAHECAAARMRGAISADLRRSFRLTFARSDA
jgi:hypothetical protein